MADYFDRTYFDETYFDTDAAPVATHTFSGGGTPARKVRVRRIQPQQPAPEPVDTEDWLTLLL